MKVIFYNIREFFIVKVTAIIVLLDYEVILLDKADKNGLPNGDIHAA